MKELAQNLFYSARNNFSGMHKSKMTLTERIKYEKAMTQMEILEKVLNKLQNP